MKTIAGGAAVAAVVGAGRADAQTIGAASTSAAIAVSRSPVAAMSTPFVGLSLLERAARVQSLAPRAHKALKRRHGTAVPSAPFVSAALRALDAFLAARNRA